jgi:hypothetical protein
MNDIYLEKQDNKNELLILAEIIVQHHEQN